MNDIDTQANGPPEASTLTEASVKKVFLYCLFNTGEEVLNPALATGLTLAVGFHPGRLSEMTGEVQTLLAQLPESFKRTQGASFVEASVDKLGNKWGELQSVQELFLLGLASDQVSEVIPREIWRYAKGGMPYYHVIKKTLES